MQRVSWTDICLFPRSAGRRRAGAGERAEGKASKEPGAAREAVPGLRSRSAAADVVCHLV